jgi:hypothetical protein
MPVEASEPVFFPAGAGVVVDGADVGGVDVGGASGM